MKWVSLAGRVEWGHSWLGGNYPLSFAQFKQPSAFHGRSLISSVESRSLFIPETDPAISISSQILELWNQNFSKIPRPQKCGENDWEIVLFSIKFNEIPRRLLSALKKIISCSLVLLTFVFYSFRLSISSLSPSQLLYSLISHTVHSTAIRCSLLFSSLFLSMPDNHS